MDLSISSIAGSATGIVSTLADFIPTDVRARVEERVRQYNPWQTIRANHVLTRGVRLAWADAMLSVQRQMAAVASEAPSEIGGNFEKFKALVDERVAAVSDNAANRDPGVKLAQYDSLDTYTLLVLETLPKYLRHDEVAVPDAASVQRFVRTLQELTGWGESEIPMIYKGIGGQEFQKADGEARSFEQLLLDAFSYRLNNQQDPGLALSFQAAQQDIAQAHLELILETVRDLQPVRAEEIVLELAGPIRDLGERIDRRFRGYVERLGLSHDRQVAPDLGYYIEPIHRLDRSGGELRGLESLHFRNRQDILKGRDDLLEDLLERFLGGALRGEAAEPFLWTLVYGVAGTGKSRLALDVLLLAEKAYKAAHNAVEPEFFGFLDRNGCCDAEGLRLDTIDRWTPTAPAFVVIDYAGSLNRLPEAIAGLKACAERSGQPIRLLLLDRKATGTLEELALRTNTSKPHVATRFETTIEANRAQAGIRLRGLSRENALNIIHNRLGERSADFSDIYLLKRLDSIRPDTGSGTAGSGTYRPLFAAMIGEFLAARSEAEVEGDHALKLLNDREEILEQIIFRERKTFWTKRAEELCDNPRDSQELLERHENLLAMSTFCRGLRANTVQDLAAGSSAPLPSPPFAFNSSLFDIMAGGIRQGARPGTRRVMAARRLGFVEPDLIGEWFVLSLLGFADRQEENYHLLGGRSLLDPQGFVDLCWDQGDEQLAQFVLRCYHNHPDRVRDLDYLLPSTGRHVPRVIALVRRFFDEWRALFDESGLDDSGRPQIGLDQHMIAEWAEELFGILREHIEGQDISDSAEDLLTITDHHIHFSTWLSSELVRAHARGSNQGSVAGDPKPGRGPRTLLERSKRIIEARLGRNRSLREAFSAGGGHSEAGDAFNVAADHRASDDTEEIPAAELHGTDPETQDPVAAFREGARRSFNSRSPAAQMRLKFLGRIGGLPANSVAALSAKLLKDATEFLRALASQNEEVGAEFLETAQVFDYVGDLVQEDPMQILDGVGDAQDAVNKIGARLLDDAANFFDALAEHNPALAEQMRENATVFRELAILLRRNPYEVLE